MGTKNAAIVLDYQLPLMELDNYLSLPKNVKILRVDSMGDNSVAVVVLFNRQDSRDVDYAIRRHEVVLDGGQYRDSCVLSYPDKSCILSVERRSDRDLTIWTFEPSEGKPKDRKLLVRASSRDIEHPFDKVKHLKTFVWLITEDDIIYGQLLELL